MDTVTRLTTGARAWESLSTGLDHLSVDEAEALVCFCENGADMVSEHPAIRAVLLSVATLASIRRYAILSGTTELTFDGSAGAA